LTSQKIRILLVDDNETIRHTLASLLGSCAEFKLVGECISGAEAICRAGQLRPDVILLDISLPDINGLEVARRIKAITPAAEILLLSEHCLVAMVQEGLRAGARGYLLKSDAAQELSIAIREVHKKQQYVGQRFGL